MFKMFNTGNYEDGVKALDAGDYDLAVEILEPLATMYHHTGAQYYMGVHYAHGKNPDYENAARMFQLCSLGGNSNVLGKHQWMITSGFGIGDNYREACEYYRNRAKEVFNNRDV